MRSKSLRLRDVVYRFFEVNALAADWTPLDAPEGVGDICGRLEDGAWVSAQSTRSRGVRIDRGIVLGRAPGMGDSGANE